jgi:hypothetical protein
MARTPYPVYRAYIVLTSTISLYACFAVLQRHVAQGLLSEEEEKVIQKFVRLPCSQFQETVWFDGDIFMDTADFLWLLERTQFICDGIITACGKLFKERQEANPERFEKSFFFSADFQVCIHDRLASILAGYPCVIIFFFLSGEFCVCLSLPSRGIHGTAGRAAHTSSGILKRSRALLPD